MSAEARTRNPFTASATGGRILSALQMPLFVVRPPRSYGVLTTTGRKTGKARRRCVRAVRSGNLAYLVAIKGGRTGWVRNALANPQVRLRVRGGNFAGVAREPTAAELEAARTSYCEPVDLFEYAEYVTWRKGRPSREAIRQLHREWFDQGIPLIVELR